MGQRRKGREFICVYVLGIHSVPGTGTMGEIESIRSVSLHSHPGKGTELVMC